MDCTGLPLKALQDCKPHSPMDSNTQHVLLYTVLQATQWSFLYKTHSHVRIGGNIGLSVLGQDTLWSGEAGNQTWI